MHFLDIFNADVFVPFMIFAIPIVAIVGGITAGIVRTMGQQRLLEMAQRERIAAIERGVDLSKLPPMPLHPGVTGELGSVYLDPREYQRRRSLNLLVGGVITLCVGVGVSVFLYFMDTGDHAWAVGIVPGAIGIGLLLSSWLMRPRDTVAGGPSA